MKKRLFMVYKNGYIEDYMFVYASTELEVMSEYCKEWDIEMMSIDEFYDTHTIDEINKVGDKWIKEIIFE